MSAQFVIYFMHFGYDTYLLMSQTIYSYPSVFVCFFVHEFVVITALLFVRLGVTYIVHVLALIFLILFSIQHYLYYVTCILFWFVL